MGWTLQYKAFSPKGDIEAFVEAAHKAAFWLSPRCEPFHWTVESERYAGGFTKVQYSWFPKRDFQKILRELKALSIAWPHVRIDVADDYVLGAWWNILNLDVDNVFKQPA